MADGNAEISRTSHLCFSIDTAEVCVEVPVRICLADVIERDVIGAHRVLVIGLQVRKGNGCLHGPTRPVTASEIF